MKIKFLPILTLLIASFALTSCFNASEELWIDSDGTGRYESTNDFSSLYPFMLMGLQQGDTGDSATEEEEDEKDFENDMKRLLLAEKTDTVFDLSGIFAAAAAEKGVTLDQMMAEMEAEMKADDTMPEDQKEAIFGMIKGLMDMKLRMQASQAEQMLKTTSIQRFQNLNELTNFGETMSGLIPLLAGAGGGVPTEALGAMDQLFNSMTQFDLDGRTLRIRRAGIDLQALAGDNAEAQQSIGMLKMFLGNQPYRLVVHLPGKVKKISSDYVTKVDKTTVALEIPMSELFNPDLRVDAEITFKG
ncbi:MAG: hypothetical protein D6772_16165, partial [Bacteroidetes bacterium]